MTAGNQVNYTKRLTMAMVIYMSYCPPATILLVRLIEKKTIGFQIKGPEKHLTISVTP